ncbi:MAG: bifunctional glutamate N-acetyltransferase/amino-acid acetyltransferase ArgJ [Tepidamorphaceae bacterium]|nr:bifunctional glutamate N-acetyltransferase/amino-acid acetyltransferase ArgJ [Rhodobiaceae bacterium]MCC0050088.1 bifunctional glutamate N-acetyltransferase/amino-acid acetyltransferase ArgJ [Rhodobiaceae bacterium]
MSATVSPLAPKSFADPEPVEGVRLAVAQAGIKYKGRTDLLVALFDPGTTVAGVFTTSKCPSAPVEWCREALKGESARALVVNSGNANAFTGLKGRETVSETAKAAAKAAGCKKREIFLASTGVIGEPLPPAKFTAVLDKVVADAGAARPLDAARAIMTTDTFPKVLSRTVRLGDTDVTITGIAKGAGMIAPDMATMLSFVFTDAPIKAQVLQGMLSKAVKGSFNAITVDSDTSTSDTLMIFATGAAAKRGAPKIKEASDRRLAAFKKALKGLLTDLAHQVVRDGEGARKFVQIDVTGAKSAASAKRIALSIANSPLVKTAIAGEDANWGRIVMAVGKAGEPADRDRLAIRFGDLLVAEKGERVAGYSEEEASAYMKREDIVISVDLGLGRGKGRVWTCDLTKEYVAINGDYRS